MYWWRYRRKTLERSVFMRTFFVGFLDDLFLEAIHLNLRGWWTFLDEIYWNESMEFLGHWEIVWGFETLAVALARFWVRSCRLGRNGCSLKRGRFATRYFGILLSRVQVNRWWVLYWGKDSLENFISDKPYWNSRLDSGWTRMRASRISWRFAVDGGCVKHAVLCRVALSCRRKLESKRTMNSFRFEILRWVGSHLFHSILFRLSRNATELYRIWMVDCACAFGIVVL